MTSMKDLLKATKPRLEIVFAWQDSETEARGWLVPRGGAAGGEPA